jgi:GNAT superfamily N-acetyltransferase
MRIWTRADAPAFCALVDVTLPGELLSADEVVSTCFEDGDPSIVLALPGAQGAAAAVVRTIGGQRVTHLLLLAVEPAAQGRGLGRQLLAAVEEWAFDGMGSTAIRTGGWSPFGLWPGVDVRWTRSLCLFEAAGYQAGEVALVLSCPSTYRAPCPERVEVRRVLQDRDAAAALSWSDRHLPGWHYQIGRAVEHGSCLLALERGEIAGLVCHSVNRTGWLGPITVAPARRGTGIGRALLSAACIDLRAAGHADVQIATPAPIGFFARSAGASVSRVFHCYVKAERASGRGDPLKGSTLPACVAPSSVADRATGGSRSR